jgi:short-subunit dehydrogenase
MDLKDKTAVVVGATGGIGREISKALAKEGVCVNLVARRMELLDALRRNIEDEGGKASVYLADLTDENSVSELVKNLKKEFDKIDILFNVAGIGVYKKFPDVSYDEWRKSMAVNLDSVFLATQKLLPFLEKSEKAYVISMGSGMGKIAVAGRSAYCTSKFALRGLMQTLSKEYAKSHIRFVLMTLGSVLTAFGPLSLEDKIQKQRKGKKYMDPKWLAEHIVTKIKNDTLEPETTIYPKNYFEESKKGKT